MKSEELLGNKIIKGERRAVVAQVTGRRKGKNCKKGNIKQYM